MSNALRKMNGDLYIDRETGRSEIVNGPDRWIKSWLIFI